MLKDFLSGITDHSSDDYWYDAGMFYYQEILDALIR
jgi:hypothetical protein